MTGVDGSDELEYGCFSLTLNNRSDETRSFSCSGHMAVIFLIENVPSFTDTSINGEKVFLLGLLVKQ